MPTRSIGRKRAAKSLRNKSGRRSIVHDMREAFDDKSVDIVSTATPNHWHALVRDLGHAGRQGRVRREAGQPQRQRRPAHRRGGPQVQQDLPDRHAMPLDARHAIEAIEYVHERQDRRGEAGPRPVLQAARLDRRPRATYAVPPSVDYDLWAGPARMLPLTRPKFHYDWHWQWDYGNGDLGNQGIHQMDVARWGLGVNELCQGVLSYGGRLGYEDAGETANTQVVMFDYGDKSLIFEVRGLKTDAYKRRRRSATSSKAATATS